MSTTQEATAISFPKDIVETAGRLAAQQGCTIEEWFQGLVAHQERASAWREVSEFGLETGRASGYTEGDVVRMTREIRQKRFEARAVAK